MLSKVRAQNKVEASKILLAMSNSVENCLAMRECGKIIIFFYVIALAYSVLCLLLHIQSVGSAF